MSSGRKIGNFGRAGLLLVAAALFAAMALPRGAAASSEQVLYSFCGQFNCTDGLGPVAGLVMDAAGNLYGTTYSGGTPGVCERTQGCGVVFALAPGGAETVLYTFCPQGGACPDGGNPYSGLLRDAAGNLYGTTLRGGAGASCAFADGCGVVFRLAPDETETVLYSFCEQSGCADGYEPLSDLIMDAAGNLYGTTAGGGTGGAGVVFRLSPDGMYAVLYAFCPQGGGCADGASPFAGLVMDAAGNLYGTTNGGGAFNRGAVFALAANGTQTVLYSFCAQPGCADGYLPEAGTLVIDPAGNLYGTTLQGGAGAACPYDIGCGVVFALAPGGAETVLYNFCSQSGCADGVDPYAGLLMDGAGNLYGTTYNGGGPHNAGVAFKLAPGGTQTVLYSFCSVIFCFDGSFPAGALVMDAAGILYGTTQGGGAGSQGPGGVVFKVTP